MDRKEPSHVERPDYDAEITHHKEERWQLTRESWEHGVQNSRKILRNLPQGLRARIYLCTIKFCWDN
jgi:hypothetical protein